MEESKLASQSNSVLVERYVRLRDDDAFAEIVRRFGPMVLGVARRFLSFRDDADDAAQIVFAELARRAGTIEDPALVGSWLHTVTVRVVHRLRQRQPNTFPLASDPVDPRLSLDDLGQRSDLEVLSEELEKLPAAWREPLLLRYFAGLPNDSAAHQLETTQQAYEGRLKRGRNALRVRLLRRGVGVTAVLAMIKPAEVEADFDHWSAVTEAAQELAADPTTLTFLPSAPASISTPLITGKAAAATGVVAVVLAMLGGEAIGPPSPDDVMPITTVFAEPPGTASAPGESGPRDNMAAGKLTLVDEIEHTASNDPAAFIVKAYELQHLAISNDRLSTWVSALSRLIPADASVAYDRDAHRLVVRATSDQHTAFEAMLNALGRQDGAVVSNQLETSNNDARTLTGKNFRITVDGRDIDITADGRDGVRMQLSPTANAVEGTVEQVGPTLMLAPPEVVDGDPALDNAERLPILGLTISRDPTKQVPDGYEVGYEVLAVDHNGPSANQIEVGDVLLEYLGSIASESSPANVGFTVNDAELFWSGGVRETIDRTVVPTTIARNGVIKQLRIEVSDATVAAIREARAEYASTLSDTAAATAVPTSQPTSYTTTSFSNEGLEKLFYGKPDENGVIRPNNEERVWRRLVEEANEALFRPHGTEVHFVQVDSFGEAEIQFPNTAPIGDLLLHVFLVKRGMEIDAEWRDGIRDNLKATKIDDLLGEVDAERASNDEVPDWVRQTLHRLGQETSDIANGKQPASPQPSVSNGDQGNPARSERSNSTYDPEFLVGLIDDREVTECWNDLVDAANSDLFHEHDVNVHLIEVSPDGAATFAIAATERPSTNHNEVSTTIPGVEVAFDHYALRWRLRQLEAAKITRPNVIDRVRSQLQTLESFYRNSTSEVKEVVELATYPLWVRRAILDLDEPSADHTHPQTDQQSPTASPTVSTLPLDFRFATDPSRLPPPSFWKLLKQRLATDAAAPYPYTFEIPNKPTAVVIAKLNHRLLSLSANSVRSRPASQAKLAETKAFNQKLERGALIAYQLLAEQGLLKPHSADAQSITLTTTDGREIAANVTIPLADTNTITREISRMLNGHPKPSTEADVEAKPVEAKPIGPTNPAERALYGTAPTTVFSTETKLSFFVQWLRDTCYVPIRLDEAALQQAGISADQTFTLNRMFSTVDALLNEVIRHHYEGLEYVIQGDEIVVTSRKSLSTSE